MQDRRSECTRRELIRQGSGLFAATVLVATPIAAAAPNGTPPPPASPPSARPLVMPFEASSARQNARLLCMAAGGV